MGHRTGEMVVAEAASTSKRCPGRGVYINSSTVGRSKLSGEEMDRGREKAGGQYRMCCSKVQSERLSVNSREVIRWLRRKSR